MLEREVGTRPDLCAQLGRRDLPDQRQDLRGLERILCDRFRDPARGEPDGGTAGQGERIGAALMQDLDETFQLSHGWT